MVARDKTKNLLELMNELNATCCTESLFGAQCFKPFKEDDVDFCSCDPAIEDRSLSTFSFLEALMLCSMRCSQTASCVAYNFFNATNQCQLFNQTLNKFSVLARLPILFQKRNISLQPNFPHALDITTPDRYNLTGNVYVVAAKLHNNMAAGGFIASTADNYILTNETWKCTMNYYDGWYKINYNDSFWPAAQLEIWQGDSTINSFFSKEAKWINHPNDCPNCDFFCRKSFIGEF
ncbi:hypothetical protein HELRODRAFT_171922 [Helobdella robusta]|uniref:Apple domain-containing protein n=1 Tax=Helobdella robusta TaxID=6412 RepID=T1F4V1_HELRO|nr:hypothetical protein HELRODRAFT_171922 [Helobdella robusta]ESO04920.1 hypothetical protein HELRODRAFT_171922 [Helobdella robusta]